MTPIAGSKEYENFIRRAKDSTSVEGQMMGKVLADATAQAQATLRKMLAEMVELAPGRLFRDIQAFHQKFGLEPTTDPGHRLPEDLLRFRLKCLFEELSEYCEAVGATINVNGTHDPLVVFGDRFDAEAAFDALLDLCWFAIGTAYLHRFPWDEGWLRVQTANMSKVRAEKASDSKRGSAYDIVKPPDFKPPVLKDLL